MKSTQDDLSAVTVHKTEPAKPETSFDANRTGRGTKEWSEVGLNIQIGCSHLCAYCYSCFNATRRFKTCTSGEWGHEVLTKNALMTTYPKRRGVVMYPTAHDIVPANLDASIRVLKLVLDSGNNVLVVSKPHLDCITRLVDDLAGWKDRIMFRFSIGSVSETVCKLWEPGAPTPAEGLRHFRWPGQPATARPSPLNRSWED